VSGAGTGWRTTIQQWFCFRFVLALGACSLSWATSAQCHLSWALLAERICDLPGPESRSQPIIR
jgi:hypothetical protein